MEPTHKAILDAVADLKDTLVAHMADSKARGEVVSGQLADHRAQLSVIPVMQHKLDENTALTAALLEKKRFWDGVRQRWIALGMVAGATGGIVGLWMALKNLLGSGPPPGMGPHP